jgi:transaldolase/glucose-6-phosphate isomerase
MTVHRLLDLTNAGQSIWLDYLHREILDDGELRRLIEVDGLKGMTSNPSIFEKAIGQGSDYDAGLRANLVDGDLEAGALYEALAIADIQAAADQFRPVYDRLARDDGYVSLEVSPYLAMDTEGTIAEARRLWAAVDRPNVMIKVPGTLPGVPAIRRLIGEGININVTLLFSRGACQAVAEAYMAGLEALRAAGGDITEVRSVASLFVSRIDSEIDKAIDQQLTQGDSQATALKAVRGKVAIANAKLAYQDYLERLGSLRWQALAQAGGAPQRLLWASTGTKDPTYSDVLYVESLIGADTINTMPPKTMDAFRDHGRVAHTLTDGVDEARDVLASAEALGLDLEGVTNRLVTDGVRQFAEAFDKLLAAVADKRTKVLGPRLNSQVMHLPIPLQAELDGAIATATSEGWTRRLWAGDARLWTNADEGQWLGWLAAARGKSANLRDLKALQAEVKASAFRHAVLLCMGGSSLGPEVLSRVLGAAPGFPPLLILDSTNPAQIRDITRQIEPATTLFIVSSKSGTTLESDILHRHFFKLATDAVGAGQAFAHFIAITDPGSPLAEIARREDFPQVFLGDPDIGGRYSVLSNFGLAPAAILGLDLVALLRDAALMAISCGPSVPPDANPGVRLGLLLGRAANAGRNKITLLASEEVAPLGAWIEQLLAESTGKDGKGLIPIDAEPLGPIEAYGRDRVFVSLRLAGSDQPELDATVRALKERGDPVVEISMTEARCLPQEFVRWEIATAIAGAVMGLNPFDQPDVEASKIKSETLTDAYEQTGRLPPEEPIASDGTLSLYADDRNASHLRQLAGSLSFDALLGAHLARAEGGDYIALLAYLDRNPAHIAALQDVRARLRDQRKVATALGFGPRFQHSTGQAYKGGPNTGVFLQITAPCGDDIPVPGRRLTFGVIEAAQARGDFLVLSELGRRLLRVDLGSDIDHGLARFAQAVERALGGGK